MERVVLDRIKRDKFFKILNSIAITECNSIFLDVPSYVEKTYGIKVENNGMGILGEYVVVNEQKYMLFKIKFGI